MQVNSFVVLKLDMLFQIIHCQGNKEIPKYEVRKQNQVVSSTASGKEFLHLVHPLTETFSGRVLSLGE